MVKQMTKIEMNITLEGEDAMRILRAIVAEGTENKPSVVIVATEPKRKILKPTVPKMTVGSTNKMLNGKHIKRRDLELVRIYHMKESKELLKGSVTAKWVAEKTGKSLNQVYSFAKRYGVKWDSGYGKPATPKPTGKAVNRLLKKAYKTKPRLTCNEAADAANVSYAMAYNWAKKHNKKWAKAKLGRPKGSK